jgi:hypothetical protein
MNPIKMDGFNIYDIFHSSQLVIITPYIPTPYTIQYGSLTFELYTCPHKHTHIYTLPIDYIPTITLNINGTTIETNVNKYPTFKDEIIFSTMVKNEDNVIMPWIHFHLRLGVTRFIIYDNSESDDKLSYTSIETNSNLKLLLHEYIKKNIVILIN